MRKIDRELIASAAQGLLLGMVALPKFAKSKEVQQLAEAFRAAIAPLAKGKPSFVVLEAEVLMTVITAALLLENQPPPPEALRLFRRMLDTFFAAMDEKVPAKDIDAATAALQAEVEALKAEVEVLKAEGKASNENRDEDDGTGKGPA